MTNGGSDNNEEEQMKTKTWVAAVGITALGLMALVGMAACNDGLASARDDSRQKKPEIRDRSQRTQIDSAEYIDFTSPQFNAKSHRREDMLFALNGSTFRNGNSYIKINALNGTIEISSDAGRFNGSEQVQVYGVFGFDIMAAGEDCLYIRRNQRSDGFVLFGGQTFRNDAIPDLAVCLPLYGYSRNRIEISTIMDGFIAMPSGTYWRQ